MNETLITTLSRVLMELVDASGQSERREIRLVPKRQADLRSGLLDENTPLARALLGHHAGEVIPYAVGDLKEIRVLGVTNEAGDIPSGPSDAAEKRRSDVQKAELQSEATAQMIFATASGSKWGDYDLDVDKIMKDHEKEQEKKEE